MGKVGRPPSDGIRCVVCGRIIKKNRELMHIGNGMYRHKNHTTKTILSAYNRRRDGVVGTSEEGSRSIP